MTIKLLSVRYLVNHELRERSLPFVYDSLMGITRYEAAKIEIIETQCLSSNDFRIIDVT